jgi:hypothetical protein
MVVAFEFELGMTLSVVVGVVGGVGSVGIS